MATAQLTPRQAERRERILDTVREHLSRLGYEGLSMRDVADAAGVSPTTLYNLFQNKDNLVLAAQEDLLDQLAELARGQDKRGLDYLITTAEGISEQVVKTPRYAETMTKLLFRGEPGDPICQILLGDVMRQNHSRVEEMIELGEIRADVDVETLARCLTIDIWGTILLWLKGFIALQDLQREYVGRLLMTLAPLLTPEARQQYRRRMNRVGALIGE